MLKQLAFAAAISCLAANIASSQEGRFRVGQRVERPTTKEFGTIIAINASAHQVQVRFDGRQDGAWIFWGTPDLQPSNKPAPAVNAPAQAVPSPVANAPGALRQNATAPNPARGQQTAGDWDQARGESCADKARLGQTEANPPDNATPTADTFKQLVRAHQIPDMNETKRTEFEVFQLLGKVGYEDPYAGNLAQATILGGAGHVFQAFKAHARFSVRDCHGSINDPDQLRVWEGDLYFYKDQEAHWNYSSPNIQRVGKTVSIVKH